jgi:hypothetical protein
MGYPRVMRIRQRLEVPEISDVAAHVRQELRSVGLASRVPSGARIAVTAGSRGISSLPEVLLTLGEELRVIGAEPFVVPAMGSHGGATPRGQLEILESLGVTEGSVHMPVRSSLEVVQVGELPTGMPVYMDKFAKEADGTVLVNRVKPHSPWSRDVGSGLLKISSIGLGKQKGCSTIHSYSVDDWRALYSNIREYAKVVIEKAPVLFGIAVIDNAFARPGKIVAVGSEDIPDVEPGLLEDAARLNGRLPFRDLDVLIVDRIGKNIAPDGFDMLVIGRPGGGPPKIKRIIALDVTDESHGNAIGICHADFTTRRLASRIDYRALHMNALSSMDPNGAKIPIIADTDRDALDMALSTIGPVSAEQARLMRISDCIHLDEMYISEALARDVAGRSDLEPLSDLQPLHLDEEGSLL